MDTGKLHKLYASATILRVSSEVKGLVRALEVFLSSLRAE
jgi:hypothetical protein